MPERRSTGDTESVNNRVVLGDLRIFQLRKTNECEENSLRKHPARVREIVLELDDSRLFL